MRKTNCAIQWIEIYPVDIFIYREGVENNNFDPTIYLRQKGRTRKHLWFVQLVAFNYKINPLPSLRKRYMSWGILKFHWNVLFLKVTLIFQGHRLLWKFANIMSILTQKSVVWRVSFCTVALIILILHHVCKCKHIFVRGGYLFGHPSTTWTFSKLQSLQYYFPENFRCNLQFCENENFSNPSSNPKILVFLFVRNIAYIRGWNG